MFDFLEQAPIVYGAVLPNVTESTLSFRSNMHQPNRPSGAEILVCRGHASAVRLQVILTS